MTRLTQFTLHQWSCLLMVLNFIVVIGLLIFDVGSLIPPSMMLVISGTFAAIGICSFNFPFSEGNKREKNSEPPLRKLLTKKNEIAVVDALLRRISRLVLTTTELRVEEKLEILEAHAALSRLFYLVEDTSTKDKQEKYNC